ncbi:hypothetical protein [Staphylococcus xylosus]|uniref:hypothetical protein n=1 Tax=Staphylococcus xylosus TaxID=1288 RepID=UPI002DB79B47|nr:hypothetical protein [Staphylococcus xylosus]MEB6229069.1 hypothetical protein [Staphylococcus xylosus]
MHYIDPLKNVRAIINKNISTLKSTQYLINKSFANSKYAIKSVNELNNLYRKTLLEIGNAGVLNLKLSGITTVPNFKNFQSNLFSNDSMNSFKELVDINFDTIDKTIEIMRYEYVKNSLFNTKLIKVINWEPVVFKPDKEITNINTYNIDNDANTSKKIHEATPKLELFLLSVLSDNLVDSITPLVEFLSVQMLPFFPENIRPFCFWLIVFVAISNHKDNNN